MVLDANGKQVGYILVNRMPWVNEFPVLGFMVGEGVSLAAVVPSVLRALKGQIPGLPTKPGAPPIKAIRFEAGRSHPVGDALGEDLTWKRLPPYAWYVRVPDLPRLIRHIAPVLERRLAHSVAAGYSGELKLDFCRGGLHLVFESGKLVAAEDWQPPIWNAKPHAGFPPLVFLQLLFGRRSLADLRYAFPDVWANDDGTRLLHALFPAQPSWLLPLD